MTTAPAVHTENELRITSICIMGNCFWIKGVNGSTIHSIISLGAYNNGVNATNGKFELKIKIFELIHIITMTFKTIVMY